MIATEGVELLEFNIANVQDSHQYLVIPRANENHEEALRKSALANYLGRVRKVLRSQLNGQNKISAINTSHLAKGGDRSNK